MNKLSKLILMLPLALAPLAGQAAPKGGSILFTCVIVYRGFDKIAE